MTTLTGSKVCVVIGRTRHKMVQMEIQEAARRGARFIEIRLDFLAKAPDFRRLLEGKPCPMIATVRRVQDGGRWSRSEPERLTLLRQAIVGGFDWVDVETDVADQVRRYGQVRRIISYHNIRGVPEDLEKIYERMCNQDADIVKVAVFAHHPSDNLRVLNLLRKAPVPTVALCMGDLGLPSRILGAYFNQAYTYAAFNKERGIAPGLPSVEEVTKLYRYEQITPETPIFGVLGDPVSHSLSPLVHNSALRYLNLPGVYLPFRVPRGDLEPFLKDFVASQLPVKGFSVTIPNKETAATLAEQQDPIVKTTHAANTLIRTETGWAAYNTDARAAIDSMLQGLPLHDDRGAPTLKDRTILLLGAGGVARALAHGLHQAGALVIIANRTAARAENLAEEVGCRAVDWAARHSVLAEIVINCTSVGMFPNTDESPLHNSYLRPGLMVFDLVYNPENTLLIKEARDRGCQVLTGVDMFVRQAALQFKLFTGQDPPLDRITRVVRRALSPAKLPEE